MRLSKNASNVLIGVVFLIGVGLALGLIASMPLAIIWSVNTLFPVAAIPYNFWSWLAVVVLNFTIFNKFSYKINK